MASGTGSASGRGGAGAAKGAASGAAAAANGASAAAKKKQDEKKAKEAKAKEEELRKKRAEEERKKKEKADKEKEKKSSSDKSKKDADKASKAAKETAEKSAREASNKTKNDKTTDKGKDKKAGQTKGSSGQKNVKNNTSTGSKSTGVHAGPVGPGGPGAASAAGLQQNKGPYAEAKAEKDKKDKQNLYANAAAAATADAAKSAYEKAVGGTAFAGSDSKPPGNAGRFAGAGDRAREDAAIFTSDKSKAAMAEEAKKAADKATAAAAKDAVERAEKQKKDAEAIARGAREAKQRQEEEEEKRFQELLKAMDDAEKKEAIDSKKITSRPAFSRTPQEKDKGKSPSKIKTLKYSGLPNDYPCIIFNSEFLPLYDGGKNTRIGDMLQLKESSKILTSQNAIKILHDVKAKDSVIVANQESLKKTVRIATDSFLNKIFTKFKELDVSLNVNKPLKDKYPTNDDFPTEEEELIKLNPSRTSYSNELARIGINVVGEQKINSLKDYLIKKGRLDEKQYAITTDTELWSIALEELKFSLSVSTVGTRNDSFNSKAYGKNSAADIKRGHSLWLNNTLELPAAADALFTTSPRSKLSIKDEVEIFKEQIETPISKLFKFNETTSIFLDRPVGGSNDTKISAAMNWNSLESDVVYAESIPRTLAKISDVLQRERSYGLSIKNYEPALKKRGFTRANDGMNVTVWDNLVGVTPDKIYEMPEKPIGEGYSLLSLAHEYAPAPDSSKYSVFTFERNDKPLSSNVNFKITTGREYYLETSLNINQNGDSYDSKRLDRLKKKFEDSLETIQIIEDFVNILNDQMGQDESYGATNVTSANFLPRYLTERFSAVTSAYRRVYSVDTQKNITIASVSKFLNWTKSERHTRFFSMTVKKIVSSLFSNESTEDSKKRGDSARKAAACLFSVCLMYSLDPENISSDNFVYKNSIDRMMEHLKNLCRRDWLQPGNPKVTVEGFDVEKAKPGEWGNGFDDGIVFDVNSIAQEVFFEKSNIFMRFLETFRDEMSLHAAYENMQYSGTDKTVYMMAYMINMMLVISCLCPENFVHHFSATKEKKPEVFNILQRIKGAVRSAPSRFKTENSFLDRFYDNPSGDSDSDSYFDLSSNRNQSNSESNNDTNASRFSNFGSNAANQTPLQLDYVDLLTTNWFKYGHEKEFDISTYYAPAANGGAYPRPLFHTRTLMRDETRDLLSEIYMIKGFIMHTIKSINSFKELLSNNFAPYLAEVLPYFYANNDLTAEQKIALFNASSTQEQMVLSNYIFSELSDRITKESGSEQKIKNVVTSFKGTNMAGVPFGSYLPLNNIEICSYTALKKYFDNQIFYKKDGSNKRIISVGVPPKMMRNLISYDSEDLNKNQQALKNIVRIKIFKVDLLHRYLIFKPLSYLFDLDRFPTRVVDNWSLDVLKGTNNSLEIPTKYWLGDKFEIHEDFIDPKCFSKFGSALTDGEKSSIYDNHATSFLLEEYIRWMTGVNVDETRYFNYEPMSTQISNLVSGFGTFASLSAGTTGTSGGATATYKNPITGVTSKIPVKTSKYEQKSGDSTSVQSVIPSFDITNTMTSYLYNETFLLRPDQILKRAIYPKKFDRTFTVIFDPDDFIIDTSAVEDRGALSQSKTELEALKKEKFITPINSKAKTAPQKYEYKLRDITPGDVYMDEYFVTIEPYLGI